MKSVVKSMRWVSLPVLLLLFAATSAHAQQGRVDIESLSSLAAKSIESIDVTVDEALIQLGAKFLKPERSPDEAKVKELLQGLKGIYVKRYVFENAGEFTDADVNPIRSQLTAPGWTRIVGVRSRKRDKSINVDVFLMSEGNVIRGLAVLATELKAVTVVNIVGPIDIEKLSQLEGRFGIPSLNLEQSGKSEDQDTEKTGKPPEK